MPWLFDEEACDVLRYFVNLKCRLMPYLYRQAVISHETGIPMMRPMVLEFAGEPGMKDLDMQYMLGESLLAAPVFCEDGRVEYYLPEGIWTHLLSGQGREGGCWCEDTYDYFSLPLYVRENTLLAIGNNEKLPDYDYAEGVNLCLYMLHDGGRAECRVPDPEGNTVLTASAVREGNRITLRVDKLGKHPKFVLMGIRKAGTVTGGSVEAKECGLVIRPESAEVIVELA